jgi:hypothetical protein
MENEIGGLKLQLEERKLKRKRREEIQRKEDGDL